MLDRVREVERADRPQRGDTEDPVGKAREELLGEAHALLAEDERVPGRVCALEVALSRDRAQKVQFSARTLIRPRVEEVLEIHVRPDVDQVPVVDARPPYAVLVDAKPERPDEVQRRGRRDAQAGHVARVRGDLRLHENHVKGDGQWPGPEPLGRRGGLRQSSDTSLTLGAGKP